MYGRGLSSGNPELFVECCDAEGSGYRISASQYYLAFQTKTRGGEWTRVYPREA